MKFRLPWKKNMINKELLAFTRRFICNTYDDFGNSSKHDQGSWFKGDLSDVVITGKSLAENPHICGTSGCVAGWGALFAGWMRCRKATVVGSSNLAGPEDVRLADGRIVWNPFSASDTVVDPATGNYESMREAARIEFGLNDSQAQILFSSARNIAEIDYLVDRLLENGDADLYVELDNYYRSRIG